MNEAFRTMIIPDAQVALARQITETLAPVGGANMYTTGLSPDGTAPATHWISSGFIDADYAALMPLSEFTYDENGDEQETVIDWGHPAVIMQMCMQAVEPEVPEFTLEDVIAMLDAADVTLETPQQSWARLGLQLVTEEEAL